MRQKPMPRELLKNSVWKKSLTTSVVSRKGGLSFSTEPRISDNTRSKVEWKCPWFTRMKRKTSRSNSGCWRIELGLRRFWGRISSDICRGKAKLILMMELRKVVWMSHSCQCRWGLLFLRNRLLPLNRGVVTTNFKLGAWASAKEKMLWPW